MLHAATSTGKPYNLALLDARMPKMDGFILANAIRFDPIFAKTQLVLLTSFGQALSAAELNAAGIQACLVKPIRQSRLFDCLVTAIGQKADEIPSPCPL